ncbi:MAG: EAL domain-containing protein [Turicibacter sanguinis]|uniref:EAL domain-containing protein n=1 Tax=Turicibacter sanguinis TaxID=154288 RepID=UPI002F95B92C
MDNSLGEEPIKVGFYDSDPYYIIDRNGDRSGYYHELMELVAKSLNLSYEYVDISMEEALEKLNNHEIDLLFGVAMTTERQTQYVYSKYYIAHDAMSIITNQEIRFGELEALSGLTYGYINNSFSYEQFLQHLEQQGINVNIKAIDSMETLELLMTNRDIDFTLVSSYDKAFKQFNEIYKISSGPLYAVTYKGNEALMEKFNSYFELVSTKNNSLKNLYNKYFNDYKKQFEFYLILFVLVLMGVGTFSIRKLISKSEQNTRRKQLMNKLENDEFLLYYQPIIDPDQNKIMACEALLRLKEGERILTPFHFLTIIEELDMIEEITLWVLRQVIKDYKGIKINNFNLDEEFYISINVSFKELSSYSFIEEVKNIISKIDLQEIKLCFEIVEKYQLDNHVLVNEIINELRSLGIKVAIDDFGVEYSNLDILDKIDYDIIKLDKHFIDEIQTSFVRQESVIFIGKIIEHYQKRMVMEGVEHQEQLDVLKALYPGAVYIQGYLYSPPISLEEIKVFMITNSD